VTPSGEIVRETGFPNGGYDIERLRTGEESAGGYSMRALRERSNVSGASVEARQTCGSFRGCLEGSITSLAPSLLLHGVLFVLPDPITPLGGAAFLVQLLVVSVWAGVETYVRRQRLIGLLA